jgi:formylglycine-generating enzyme required for sulfatase activity
MVYVPAGEFEMGSTEGDDDEQPVHTVELDGFWIDRTEVTNAQYRRCVEAGDCSPPAESGSAFRDSYYGDSLYDNYPVIYVNWHQAAGYCAWAGGRMPTEAEWEYAARGPEGRVFPWGDEFDGTRLNYCDANCPWESADEAVDDGYADNAPVGTYPGGASWCGALEMAGNVREWVADWYGDYPSGRQVNPTGPASGESRVLRGASWNYAQYFARCASRSRFSPDDRDGIIGFRCARPTLESVATWTRPADGMAMVYVPAGEFEMGSTEGSDNEKPVHTVALEGFWIDRTEVTNAQYRRCVQAGDCSPPKGSSSSTRESYYGNGTYDDYPVIQVTWQQAAAYCAWAEARLPTEAEWEYAARGPEGRVFPWGDEFDGTRLNYCDVNCPEQWADETVDDGYADTAPVGSYPGGASWCGALDMVGNVWEWVADWLGDYPSGRQVSPTGPSSGEYRVDRGGSWFDSWLIARCAHRSRGHPGIWYDSVGFRCARVSR